RRRSFDGRGSGVQRNGREVGGRPASHFQAIQAGEFGGGGEFELEPRKQTLYPPWILFARRVGHVPVRPNQIDRVLGKSSLPGAGAPGKLMQREAAAGAHFSQPVLGPAIDMHLPTERPKRREGVS